MGGTLAASVLQTPSLTLWALDGMPLATSFGAKSTSMHMISSAEPVWGILVTNIVRGAACSSRSRFSGVPRKTQMRSLINISVFLVTVVGAFTAMGGSSCKWSARVWRFWLRGVRLD